MQMRRCLVHMKNRTEHLEIRISLFKAVHILSQHSLCSFRIDSANARVLHISDLHNVLVKALALIRRCDHIRRISPAELMLIVVYCNFAIIPLLLCVILVDSTVEQLFVHLLLGYVHENNIVLCSGAINIIRRKQPQIVGQTALALT